MRVSSVFAGLIVLILLMSAAFLSAQGAGGEPPVLALEIDRVEVPLDFGRRVVDAEAEYLIDLDPSVVAADPDVLSLDMYRETRLEARRIGFRIRDDWVAWSGNLYFPDLLGLEMPAGYVLLVNRGDRVTGVVSVYATDDEFQIVASAGQHRLVRLKRERMPTCGVRSDHIDAIWEQTPDNSIEPQGFGGMPSTSGGHSEIRVLAVVPQGHLTTQAEDFIITSVEIANDAFNFSLAHHDVGVEYVLTGISEMVTVPLAPPPSPPASDKRMESYLLWMNTGGIDQHRDYYQADMVALFVPPDAYPYCGIANLRFLHPDGIERIITGFAWREWTNQAFSVQVIGCGMNDVTFAHELGHNFGLRHDSATLEAPWLPLEDYPNPRGHLFWTTRWGQKATVMGCVGGAAPCNRVLYYSDPTFILPFWGVEPTGSIEDRADAVSVLIGMAEEYSNLWQP